jgi:hypothetical protein
MSLRRSIAENIQAGRARLVQITGVDFGYDLQRWHDHLKTLPQAESRGYTWNRTIKLPRVMQLALANAAWQSAVAALQAQPTSVSEPNNESRGDS